MQYYIVSEEAFPKEPENKGKQYSRANGDRIPDDQNYFKRIHEGELIKEAPVFGPFFLESFAAPHTWEWCLLDVHYFTGKVGDIGWLVSPEVKEFLESMHLGNAHSFHESKLLYRGVEKESYVFQYKDASLVTQENNEVIDFENSEFLDSKTGNKLEIKDFAHYKEVLKGLKEAEGVVYGIIHSELVLKEQVDFFKLGLSGIAFEIVSQRFKDTFEEKGFKGLEFEVIKDYNHYISPVKDLNITVRG